MVLTTKNDFFTVTSSAVEKKVKVISKLIQYLKHHNPGDDKSGLITDEKI